MLASSYAPLTACHAAETVGEPNNAAVDAYPLFTSDSVRTATYVDGRPVLFGERGFDPTGAERAFGRLLDCMDEAPGNTIPHLFLMTVHIHNLLSLRDPVEGWKGLTDLASFLDEVTGQAAARGFAVRYAVLPELF